MTDKKQLRSEIRARKKATDVAEMERQSQMLCQKISQHPRWQSATTVLLYHPLSDEVDTRNLIASTDKRILLPVVVGDVLELRLSNGVYKEGAFGILEPQGSLLTDYASIDLAIVPGMAFDRHGNRLGRGKGYYDRLFAALASAGVYKMGVCFDFQLLDTVPAEKHDVVMDEVISV